MPYFQVTHKRTGEIFRVCAPTSVDAVDDVMSEHDDFDYDDLDVLETEDANDEQDDPPLAA